ncbi:corrinoid ABC transporter permease [Dialister hominis]|uniref:Corrinoid ABC transporter permease n=1 Tax=Dialister hominis TaxID=2582419 RepID=A0A8D5A0P3_9FIRM|nr:corrinoid ABC transporter permease [Dialister hominis]
MNEIETDETIKSKSLKIIIILFFTGFTIFAMVASLTLGSVDISFSTIVHTLLGNVQTTDEMVIWNIRFPRNIVGALVGANLAVSGAILQAVMKNPLADPGIVGVSSGAGLAGVIMLIFMPEASILLTPVAFVGAMLSAAAVYALAWKNGIRPTRIILAGVAVSAFLGSGISALLVFYSDKVQGALLWMVGGLSARSWPQVETLFPYTILGLVLALAGCKALTILSLGDETARGLGVPVERVRFSMTAVAALLAAGAVSVAGLIGFVGLVVPHIVRLIIGTDYKYVIPGSAILGAGVLVFCDTLGRVAFSPIEIPAGIIMAFLGAPFFLYLLRRSS